MSFTNKIVIVTGGNSGIGACLSKRLTEEGANVVIVGRNVTKLKKINEECTKLGKAPFIIAADVTNDEETASIVTKTLEKYGRIDILVSNAGRMKEGTVLKGNLLEVFDEMIKTNLRPSVHLTELVAPHLIKTKGNILYVSSIASLVTAPSPGFLPYGAAKAGLDYFMKSVASELGPYGVRANCINPGPVITEFIQTAGLTIEAFNNLGRLTALGKCLEPEEVAELCLVLISDTSKCVTGTNAICDNGYYANRH